MMIHLSTALLASMTASQSFAETAPDDYSVSQFTADCRVSGGEPTLFETSVICEAAGGQDIVCLRDRDEVSACRLGQSQDSYGHAPRSGFISIPPIKPSTYNS